MELPPLVEYATEGEYRAHFRREYCRCPLTTFDGIEVRFRTRQFDHCFFESSQRDTSKDAFSPDRTRRIDWIRAVLQDPDAELYVGWDRARRRWDDKRRVAVVLGEYVVIIALTGDLKADFVTAYLASPAPPGQMSTIQKIRRGPRWQKENR